MVSYCSLETCRINVESEFLTRDFRYYGSSRLFARLSEDWEFPSRRLEKEEVITRSNESLTRRDFYFPRQLLLINLICSRTEKKN